jgi:hypothetical protein
MVQNKVRPVLFLEHFSLFRTLNLYLLMSVIQLTTLRACFYTGPLHFIQVKDVSSFIKPKLLFYLPQLIRFIMTINLHLSAFRFYEVFLKIKPCFFVYKTNFIKFTHQTAL